MARESGKCQNIADYTASEVLKFISAQPGLSSTCHEYLPYLATCAPQLTIRGFGGEFEHEFENWYKQSLITQRKERLADSRFGSGLTFDKRPPACVDILALRHSTFGNYRPSFITCLFVQGDLMGPPVRFYGIFDYIIWFLSSNSSWMPIKIRQFLLEGFKNWATWEWLGAAHEQEYGFIPNKFTGALVKAMAATKKYERFKYTKACEIDLKTRIDHTVNMLGLKETSTILADRFINGGFIEANINKKLPKAKP